jgi:regulator of protease activity HflC (stomatin/prohibitin superfamily)
MSNHVQERPLNLMSGYLGVLLVLALLATGISLIVFGAREFPPNPVMIFSGIACLGLFLVSLFGFIVNGPNMTRVVQLFGTYVGTVRETGFFYGNPFYWRTKVSMKVRTFETGVEKSADVKDPTTGKVVSHGTSTRSPLKVNDKDGTPIEISAVVVWQVIKPTDAVFRVDNYEEFVRVQSDAALRNLASRYSYDAPEDADHSLRGHIEEVAARLKEELHARMEQAGVEIIEARISYLAYAPEIAGAMLQRQQAGAMIAARRQIVDAAVGMVEHALEELNKRNVVELDAERKAAMVSNLMVVLCGHGSPTPVVNAGTLYN